MNKQERADLVTLLRSYPSMRTALRCLSDQIDAEVTALELIQRGSDLTEEEENAVIFREIKQAQETVDTTPGDRVQIIEEAKLRISVYSEFVPKLMGEEEIREVIVSVLAELEIEKPTVKEKGKIMKTLMPRVKGKADGGLVNQVLGSFFA